MTFTPSHCSCLLYTSSYDQVTYAYATFNNIPTEEDLDVVEKEINKITREKIEMCIRDRFCRQGMVEPIEILPDGRIPQVEITTSGPSGAPLPAVELREMCIRDSRVCNAILEAWAPGAQGGEAIAALLTGTANPCGKLPCTVARHEGQIPVYYNHPTNTCYCLLYTSRCV